MNFSGVLAPVPTPFDEQGAVDLRRFRAAMGYWLRSPLRGFVVLGSSGEAPLLDDLESDELIAAAREIVPRDRLLVVGTGRESTVAAQKASRRAAALGADAVLVRTPGFFKSQMTSDVLVRHYLSVADASPAPILLYNFTAVTGVNLLPAAVAQLAEHTNVVGVKESGGDIAQVADLVSLTPPSFAVLAGSATTFYAALEVGATGGILALACVLPDLCVRLFGLVREHRHEEALRLQRQLVPIARLVGASYGVAGLKAALKIVGCDAGFPRAPLALASDEAVAALKASLQGLTTFDYA